MRRGRETAVFRVAYSGILGDVSTVEAIRIEAPDASSAAYLMQELFGSFPAELIQDDRGSWEIVVQSGPDLPGRLSELLGVVQRWVDSGDTNAVTIRFGDREHTMGPAFADRPLTREAGRATMPRRAARSVRA